MTSQIKSSGIALASMKQIGLMANQQIFPAAVVAEKHQISTFKTPLKRFAPNFLA